MLSVRNLLELAGLIKVYKTDSLAPSLMNYSNNRTPNTPNPKILGEEKRRVESDAEIALPQYRTR